jgi:Asp/Glu/hydantoin racemase
VSGSASTSRSRSLPSWPAPCSTEPKTRGLVEQKRLIASRTAFRFMSSAPDGRMVIETRPDGKRSKQALMRLLHVVFSRNYYFIIAG